MLEYQEYHFLNKQKEIEKSKKKTRTDNLQLMPEYEHDFFSDEKEISSIDYFERDLASWGVGW